MPENVRLAITGLCGFGVMAWCYIYYYILPALGIRKTYNERFIEKAKENKSIAEGVLVDKKWKISVRKSTNPTIKYYILVAKYEYVVRGKKYYKELYFESFGKFNIDYPLKIKVYYNSKNPKNAVTQYELTPSSYEGILSCLIGIYVLKIVYRLLGG